MSETPSTSAPASSHHVFVSELGKCTEGTKVRFLCCVLEYDATKGQLLVEHAFPLSTKSEIRARVDLNIVLESIKRQWLNPGAWLNVIGYVQDSASSGSVHATDLVPLPLVQGVLVWDAGTIDVQKYETATEASIKQLRACQRPSGSAYPLRDHPLMYEHVHLLDQEP